MADEALGRGNVKVLPEKMLKRKFLKIFLLGTLTGCILSLVALKSGVFFLWIGLVLVFGLILIVSKS